MYHLGLNTNKKFWNVNSEPISSGPLGDNMALHPSKKHEPVGTTKTKNRKNLTPVVKSESTPKQTVAVEKSKTETK